VYTVLTRMTEVETLPKRASVVVSDQHEEDEGDNKVRLTKDPPFIDSLISINQERPFDKVETSRDNANIMVLDDKFF
jgi:hypothetical protein